MTQLLTALTDDYMHVGGDEVVENCWLDDPTVTSWMAKMGYSADDVYEYFVNHVQKFLAVINYSIRF
jgi:N-acetyl-beta-hexosaminidase